jgi:hypothetical protein
MQRRSRPALLTVGMVLSGLMGGLAALFLVLAPFDIGTYTIDGQSVTGPEFLRREGLLMFAMAALLIGISVTLARDEPFARELMILFWILIGVLGTLIPILKGASELDASWMVALPIAVWYLYFSNGVVAYFSGRPQPGDRRLPFERPEPGTARQPPNQPAAERPDVAGHE